MVIIELLKNFYPIIKYLINDHKIKPLHTQNHLLTQNKNVCKNISAVSKIPNIVESYKDFVNKVDCIILARDDIQNHYKIANFFLEKKIPIFIDKQLVFNSAELTKIKNTIKKNKSLFVSGSTARFNNELKEIKKLIFKENYYSYQRLIDEM